MVYKANKDPLIIIGGNASFIHSNYYIGKSDLAIFEACEAYGALKNYKVDISLILNIDLDHMDYFKNPENLKKEFYQFIYSNYHEKKNKNKILLVNCDDMNIMNIIKCNNLNLNNLNFISINESLNVNLIRRNYLIQKIFHIKNIKYHTRYTTFDLYINDIYIESIKTNIIGIDLLYNVIGSLGLLHLMYNSIYIGLEVVLKFKNPERRFEKIFKHTSKKMDKKIDIYHDYAHHPKEINVFFQKVFQLKKYYWNILIFQPHLPSRFLYFFEDFIKSFSNADYVILLPSFQARENNEDNKKKNIDFIRVVNRFKQQYSNKNIDYYNKFTFDIFQYIISKYIHLKSISVSFLGAGDINILAKKIVHTLKNSINNF